MPTNLIVAAVGTKVLPPTMSEKDSWNADTTGFVRERRTLRSEHENVGGFCWGISREQCSEKDGNGIKWSPQHINVYAKFK